MKNSSLIAIRLLLLSALASLGAFDMADPVARLGLQDQQAKTFILHNIIGRFSTESVGEGDVNLSSSIFDQTKGFQIPAMKLLASVAKGDKKTAARELCEFTKAYVNSPQFRTDYQKAREAARPESEPEGLDADELAAIKESVKAMEDQLVVLKSGNQIPKSALAEYEATVKKMKAQLATQDNPHPYQTRWEKLYPEDPAAAVKARINEYLETLATVDFNAKLTGTTVNNRKFVNPQYEQKSLQWKAIYRAGQEVNDVAAAFAREWLKEGITSK